MDIVNILISIVDWCVSHGFSVAQITLLLLTILFYFKSFSPLVKKVNSIKTNFDDLHNATREIQLHLKTKRGGLTPMHGLEKLNWANSNSPFILNQRGEWLSEESGIREIINTNSASLIGALEKDGPSNGYDVELFAMKEVANYVESNLEISKKIKDFIYKNPVYETKEIGLNDIYFVGSMILRDLYLQKHTEIKLD